MEGKEKLIRAITLINNIIIDHTITIENNDDMREWVRQAIENYSIAIRVNNSLVERIENLENAAKLGEKMQRQQKEGRRKSIKIKDDEIWKLYESGVKPYQIWRQLYHFKGQKGTDICTIQTVINRIKKMKGSKNGDKET